MLQKVWVRCCAKLVLLLYLIGLYSFMLHCTYLHSGSFRLKVDVLGTLLVTKIAMSE